MRKFAHMTGDLLLLAFSLLLYIFALVFECHFFPSKLYHYLRLHLGSLYSSTYQYFIQSLTPPCPPTATTTRRAAYQTRDSETQRLSGTNPTAELFRIAGLWCESTYGRDNLSLRTMEALRDLRKKEQGREKSLAEKEERKRGEAGGKEEG
jgi:hypothetical protein